MTAQFTAGPWIAAASPSGVVGWPVVASSGRSIASVSWSPNHWQAPADEYEAFVAECAANARLIGAAPDLWLAVVELEARFGHVKCLPIDMARAALAKAQPA